MEVLQAVEYLYQPPPEDFPPYELHLLQERLERTRAQYLCDEYDALCLAVDPRPVERYDVGVVKPIEQSYLVDYVRTLGLWHTKELHNVPRHLDALDGVVRAEHDLERAAPELLLEVSLKRMYRLVWDFSTIFDDLSLFLLSSSYPSSLPYPSFTTRPRSAAWTMSRLAIAPFYFTASSQLPSLLRCCRPSFPD